MSVSSLVNRQSYTGDGSSTSFPTVFPFFLASDILVIETVIATGVQTTKALTTDYTVIGGGAVVTNGVSSPSTGTVVANTAPPSTVTWTLIRDTALTQLVTHTNNDPLPAASIDNPLDRLTLSAQRSREISARSLRQPDGDTATIATIPPKVTRASMFAAYDGNGDPIAAAGTSANLGPVSTFINTLLDDADAATARATLGFSALTTPINEAQGANIASATTTDIGAATGNYVKVTGTVAITGLGTIQAGTRRIVEFTGALVLTHNAASLILPGGQNITTAAGDAGVFVSEGAGVWRCVGYCPAIQLPAVTKWGGNIAQVVFTETGAVATGSTLIPIDDTIPQNTEGDQYMSLSITPTNSSSTLLIEMLWCGTHSASGGLTAALFQDTTANALAVASLTLVGASSIILSFRHKMVAGTTSATTFKVRVGGQNTGTTTFNGQSGSRFFGGVYASSIKITEILP